MPIALPFLRSIVGRLTSWVPTNLFPSGTTGAWYDPSVFANMYKLSDGATVTSAVEDPVGLQLDTSGGLALGAELLTNGDFTSGSTGWSKSGEDGTHILTFAGGTCRYQSGTTSPSLNLGQAGLTSGKWYKAVIVISAWTSGAVKLDGGNSAYVIDSAGTHTFYFLANGTNFNITRNGTNVDMTIDSVSCKLVTGNFGYQNTTAARPTVSARVNKLLASATMSTQNVTTLAAQYTLTFTGTGTVTLTGTSTAGPLVGTGVSDRVSLTFTPTAGTLTLTVSGSVTAAQLEFGSAITRYQAITTASAYDTIGFPQYKIYDGVDDSLTSATGGGSTTAFCFMATIQPLLIGTRQALFSDVGTNTGYKVELNTSNQLSFSAGNGTAYTTITSVNTFAVGVKYSVICFDDGTNLSLELDGGAIITAARPVVSAGTAGYTVSKDNGAATGFYKGNVFGRIYGKNTAFTQVSRNLGIQYLKNKAQIAENSASFVMLDNNSDFVTLDDGVTFLTLD